MAIFLLMIMLAQLSTCGEDAEPWSTPGSGSALTLSSQATLQRWLMKSLLSVLVVLATGWSALKAQESPPDEKAAVEKAIVSYVEAFNNADAKGLAALWNEQGQYTMPDGTTARGRRSWSRNSRRISPKRRTPNWN